MKENEINIFKPKILRNNNKKNVDPITAEIIRSGLNSAAEQMKKVLIRSAFSPIIYEVLDFASAIYDKNYCMLAQSPSLPGFMGTLSFCVEQSVKEVGGEENLFDGDIIIYNNPFGSGSHSQDAAIVKPVFLKDELKSTTKLIIVPDGPLNSLPLHVLATKSEKKNNPILYFAANNNCSS